MHAVSMRIGVSRRAGVGAVRALQALRPGTTAKAQAPHRAFSTVAEDEVNKFNAVATYVHVLTCLVLSFSHC